MDFREMLGTSSKRRLILVEVLYHERAGLASHQLLEILDCSLPVLLSDVKMINNAQENFQIEKYQGLYRLTLKVQISIAKLYSEALTNSPEFQILEQLLYEECENITKLAERLFLSDSNTQRYLKKLEPVLAKAKIKLKYRPLRLEGNEQIIRHMYYRYFYEKETGNSVFLPNLKPFQLRSIEQLVVDFIHKNDLYHLFIFQKRLIYNVYVGLWRVKNNHRFTTELQRANFELPERRKINEFSQTVSEIVQLHLTEDILKECFWTQYTNAIVFSPKQLKQAVKDPEYGQLYAQHKELVLGFEQLLGEKLSEPKHRDLIATLLNDVAYFPKDSHFITILRRSRSDFLNEIRQMHHQILSKIETLIREFTDRFQMYQKADFVENYAYLLITSVPNCLEKIAANTPKVELVLLSDLSPTEEEYLTNQIKRTIYGNFALSYVKLFEEGQRGILEEIEKYDGLITTSSMQGLSANFPMVIIEPFLNHDALYSIQQLVSGIANQKNQ